MRSKKLNLGQMLAEDLSVKPGNFELDLPRFIVSKGLVMASSGGGKSWLMRKIVEEAFGKVQIIILDIEGEFGTLAERFDFVIAGKGKGQVTVDPRHAGALAMKILETHTDLIADLYELTKHERIIFVKNFLEAMISAPKELWHEVIILLDEAHIFAPEQERAESLNAVVEMGSRGRKRGFCLVPATQRMSKLNKDLAAECQNKLIGLANIDIDRARGAAELGFTDKAKVMTLRDMKPGEFYAVGPAFAKGVSRVKIGNVKTQPPKSGPAKAKTPPPTAKVKAMLAKLADLPQQAEQEAKTMATLQAEVQGLKRALKAEQSKSKEVAIDKSAIEAAKATGRKEAWDKAYKFLGQSIVELRRKLQVDAETFYGQTMDKFKEEIRHPTVTISQPVTVKAGRYLRAVAVVNGDKATAPMVKLQIQSSDDMGFQPPQKGFTKAELAVLGVLYRNGTDKMDNDRIAARSGYSATSGSFRNTLSSLATQKMVTRYAALTALTQEGFEHCSDLELESKDLGPEDWLGSQHLTKADKKIFEVLISAEGEFVSYDRIGEQTKYEPSSGSFRNSLSHLNTLGLIERDPMIQSARVSTAFNQ